MKDWLDNPVSAYRQRVEEVYWCRRCKESYDVVLRFENETGGYDGDTACPLCDKDGAPYCEKEELRDDR